MIRVLSLAVFLTTGTANAQTQPPKTVGKNVWTAASALAAYQRRSEDPYLLIRPVIPDKLGCT